MVSLTTELLSLASTTRGDTDQTASSCCCYCSTCCGGGGYPDQFRVVWAVSTLSCLPGSVLTGKVFELNSTVNQFYGAHAHWWLFLQYLNRAQKKCVSLLSSRQSPSQRWPRSHPPPARTSQTAPRALQINSVAGAPLSLPCSTTNPRRALSARTSGSQVGIATTFIRQRNA